MDNGTIKEITAVLVGVGAEMDEESDGPCYIDTLNLIRLLREKGLEIRPILDGQFERVETIGKEQQKLTRSLGFMLSQIKCEKFISNHHPLKCAHERMSEADIHIGVYMLEEEEKTQKKVI